LKVEKLRVKR